MIKRFWRWLTDDGHGPTRDQLLIALTQHDGELLEIAKKIAERMDTLERAFAAQEQAHNAAIEELRGEKEAKQRRAPSGRPFSVLRAAAEAGARRQQG